MPGRCCTRARVGTVLVLKWTENCARLGRELSICDLQRKSCRCDLCSRTTLTESVVKGATPRFPI
eukprot:1104599-Lingulodinium_polyedra.AAC.1